MSLYNTYMGLHIQYLEQQNMVMKSLSTYNGFVNTVMAEFSYTKDLNESFLRINDMYRQLFGRKRFENLNEFLKTLS